MFMEHDVLKKPSSSSRRCPIDLPLHRQELWTTTGWLIDAIMPDECANFFALRDLGQFKLKTAQCVFYNP